MSPRIAVAAACLAALLFVAFAFLRRRDTIPEMPSRRPIAGGNAQSRPAAPGPRRRVRQAAYTALFAGVIASLLLVGRAGPASPHNPFDDRRDPPVSANEASERAGGGGPAASEILGLRGFRTEVEAVEAALATLPVRTTYYIDAVNGSDSRAGTSESTAWKSLNKASSAALLPGDRLVFKRGQAWSGQLKMAESGFSGLPIVVGAYGAGAMPVISGGNNCLTISGSYVTVQGLRLEDCAWAGAQVADGGSFNVLIGNQITRNIAGVHIDGGATNNRVLGNNIFDNTKMSRLTATPSNDDSGAFGVLLSGDYTEVANNTIARHDTFSYDYGRDGAGVEVYGGQFNHVHHNLAVDNDAFSELGNPRSSSNFFSYNVVRSSLETSTFVVTRGAQSSLGPITATRLYNNSVRFTGSQSQGFVCVDGCTRDILYLRNNVIEAVWKTGYADGAIDEDSNLYFRGQRQFPVGPNSVVGDPKFLNPGSGDLQLRSGSLAIDVGVYAPYPTDFIGQKVPQDGNGDGGPVRDMGAFEFSLASGQTATPTPTAASTPTRTPTPKPSGTATATPTPTPVATATPTPVPATSGTKTAAAETDPVPNGGDAADDPAIWVNIANPALSTVIGTNKLGGLAVYDLAGKQLHYYGGIKPNNVDVRYGFNLGGTPIDIVTASETDSDTILVYKVDPASRALISVRAQARDTGFGVSGLCMYKSPSSSKLYVFVSDSSGNVKQFELFSSGATIDYTLVRTFNFGSMTEGCVADDHHRAVYIAEEDVALWRLSAEPNGGSAKTQVAAVDGSVLTADLEGLAISDKGSGAGHIVASSQGSDDFALFDRQTGAYRGRFKVVNGSVDAVTHTDGIDVVSVPLGPSFPSGIFVAQDDSNPGGNQNFKLVPWNAGAQ